MNVLIVNAHNTLREISDFFTREYPQLKLEFFQHGHLQFAGSPPKERLDMSCTVAGCHGTDGEVHLWAGMTVIDFETQIRKQLGLNAQVFRKSGKVWLETTSTDDWTLSEQNERAKEAFH